MNRFAQTALGLLLATMPLEARQSAASTTETAQELPAARAVIDAYLKKSGYIEACANSTSVRTRGHFELLGTGIEGPFEIVAAKPYLQHFQVQLGGMGLLETGYDGEVAWELHPMVGARVFHGLEQYQTAFKAAYDEPLKPSERYEEMKTVSRVDFEGRPCWKVELVSKPTDDVGAKESLAVRTTYDYYDVETELYAGSEFTNMSAQGLMEVTAVAADYETFGKRLVPTTLTQRLPGQRVRLTVESLEYDVVDPEAFELPAKIAKIAKRGS